MWYYPAESFDVVYAVSDLHGDVDVTIRLFVDVMKVISKTTNGTWAWIAERATCVVVCGDVVDRSRMQHRGGKAYGENVYQQEWPDDLYLLHLLNQWSDLATAATPPSRLIRLLGNHEVFPRSLSAYGTEQSARLLAENIEQHIGVEDIHSNRIASFSRRHGAFHDAIWHEHSARLILQVGSILFVHAAITPQTIAYLRDVNADPNQMLETVHQYVLNPQLGLPMGIVHVLQHRALAENVHVAALRTSHILAQWAKLFPENAIPHTLVIGHTTQLATEISAEQMVHGTLLSNNGLVRRYVRPLVPVGSDLMPTINASLDPEGHPVLWRIDVGQSRAWLTEPSLLHHVIPQALELDPKLGAVATLVHPFEMI